MVTYVLFSNICGHNYMLTTWYRVAHVYTRPINLNSGHVYTRPINLNSGHVYTRPINLNSGHT